MFGYSIYASVSFITRVCFKDMHDYHRLTSFMQKLQLVYWTIHNFFCLVCMGCDFVCLSNFLSFNLISSSGLMSFALCN